MHAGGARRQCTRAVGGRGVTCGQVRFIVEGCAMGVRLVDLGRRVQQSPDAIRKARQRAFEKLRSLTVALAYEWGKKLR